MKLTICECHGIIDSRYRELQDAVEDYSGRVNQMTGSGQIFLVETIIKRAEDLKEAHEACIELEEEDETTITNEDFKIDFGIKKENN